MSPPLDLEVIWARLKPSARELLYRAMHELLNNHSGIIELHCHKGGVRLLRVGSEYRPSSKEFRLGEDDGHDEDI